MLYRIVSAILFPLLIVALPIYTYMMQTNRLICTYTILAILPTYASYRSMTAERHMVLFSLLSGVLIYLGFIARLNKITSTK